MPFLVKGHEPSWHLHEYADWYEWIDYIQRRAVNMGVWEFVKPEGDELPPEMPELPTGPGYRMSLHDQILLYNAEKQKFRFPRKLELTEDSYLEAKNSITSLVQLINDSIHGNFYPYIHGVFDCREILKILTEKMHPITFEGCFPECHTLLAREMRALLHTLSDGPKGQGQDENEVQLWLLGWRKIIQFAFELHEQEYDDSGDWQDWNEDSLAEVFHNASKVSNPTFHQLMEKSMDGNPFGEGLDSDIPYPRCSLAWCINFYLVCLKQEKTDAWKNIRDARGSSH
ncbi:hypothetical protein BT63DRAFT_467241 [Microthyrium microscopicum]|uniref:Uncharacterized protein n=1 Tax=Microthyrium microscopicum TaxID=703497 RepID=A0A6A6UMZ6_9PEZI|nr:hypothetical protein BT63DRAFT_467241 [Microthyrium microscopicum]